MIGLSMNLFVWNKQVSTPAGYAERDCVLVSYEMPLLRYCYVLCHNTHSEQSIELDSSMVGFFVSEARRLSTDVTGNPESYVIILSGSFVRKRSNLHIHVFVVRRRFQKAWLYLLLGIIHATSAMRRAVTHFFVFVRGRTKS